MYEYIKGIYQGLNKDYVILENNGIGYKIYTSGSTMSNLPKIGENLKLFTEQIVREDFIGLYGFLTLEELSMFKLLLTVSGVGAKASLSLLSISTPSNLSHAIYSADEKIIIRAPGIGKKMAARIILELKDKVSILEGDGEDIDGNALQGISSSIKEEALEALMSLGYSKSEAQGALKKNASGDSVEDIIKSSLKSLIKG